MVRLRPYCGDKGATGAGSQEREQHLLAHRCHGICKFARIIPLAKFRSVVSALGLWEFQNGIRFDFYVFLLCDGEGCI